MFDFERELFLGYIFSYKYLEALHNDKGYGYGYSQGILYLAFPYAVHISGLSTLILSLVLELNKIKLSETILFYLLIGVFLLSFWFFDQKFKRKYNREELHEEVLSTSPAVKKKLVRRSSWYFICQIVLWLVYIFLIFYP